MKFQAKKAYFWLFTLKGSVDYRTLGLSPRIQIKFCIK